MQSKAVSPQSLTYVAEQCAQNLKSLNVSGNQLTGFAGVLKKIAVSTYIKDSKNKFIWSYAVSLCDTLAYTNELLIFVMLIIILGTLLQSRSA